jgi:adenylyltransferase/sulfurtransferase
LILVDGSDNFGAHGILVNDNFSVVLGKTLVHEVSSVFEGWSFSNHQGSKIYADDSEPPNSKDVPNCSFNGVLGTFTGNDRHR